jgi:hypothetical protein
MGRKIERKQNTYAVRGMGKMGECETAGKEGREGREGGRRSTYHMTALHPDNPTLPTTDYSSALPLKMVWMTRLWTVDSAGESNKHADAGWGRWCAS